MRRGYSCWGGDMSARSSLALLRRAAMSAMPSRHFHASRAGAHKASRAEGGKHDAAPAHVHDIEINFTTRHNERIVAWCAEGDNLVEVAEDNQASVGAYFECTCGGIAACSTCHVILDEESYKLFPPPDESERDMLDLAWGVTEKSRLGCQISFTKKHSGVTLHIPEQFNNLH